MKHLLHIALVYMATLLATLCSPDINNGQPPEKKPLEVNIRNTKLFLKYGLPTECTYTVENLTGNLHVDVAIDKHADAITVETPSPEATEGVIRFLSEADVTDTATATVTFSDDTDRPVTIRLKLNIKEDTRQLDVSLNTKNITVAYGKEANITFHAANVRDKLNVTLDFGEEHEGLTYELADIVTKSLVTTEGRITLKSSLDADRTFNAKVTFSDSRFERTEQVTVTTQQKPVAPPAALTLQDGVGTCVIYPARKGATVAFSVDCPDEFQVTAEGPDNVKAEIVMDDNGKDGVLNISADTLDEDAEVVLKASNRAGEVSVKIRVAAAFLRFEQPTVTCPFAAAEREIAIDTNVEVGEMAVEGSFFTATADDECVRLSLEEYTEIGTVNTRQGCIRVKDTEGLLEASVTVIQTGMAGSFETDMVALRAIHEAFMMKDWTETGAFGVYTKNWLTDVSPFKWAGLQWSHVPGDENTPDRVIDLDLRNIRFGSYEPSDVRDVTPPDEINYLDAVKEITINGNVNLVKPFRVDNLKKLTGFGVYGGNNGWLLPESNGYNGFQHTSLSFDLSEWTSLEALVRDEAAKISKISFNDTGLHGTYPEWAALLDGEFDSFSIGGCHFSGEIPQICTKAPYFYSDVMAKIVVSAALITNPHFDPTGYETVEDADGILCYKFYAGEEAIYTQADNYALWIGERPEDTVWVDDPLGGHWEWTNPMPKGKWVQVPGDQYRNGYYYKWVLEDGREFTLPY